MLKLVIANKAYSSWSLRPWLAMKQMGLPFEEKLIPLQQPRTAALIRAEGGGATLPILHDGEVTVWESIAILDYLNETHAGGRLWPQAPAARAFARSIAAEMHAGFAALRAHCPMNVRRPPLRYALTPKAKADVDRILALWTRAREGFGQGGSFLFGDFSAADAMYAPVVLRLQFYGVPVPPAIRAYMTAILALPAMYQWISAAEQEPWVLADLER